MDNYVVNILIDGRQLVEQGWGQGHYRQEVDGEIRYCAVGAIRIVCGLPHVLDLLTPESKRVFSYLLRALPKYQKTGLFTRLRMRWDNYHNHLLIEYNDAPERTKDEVLAWFDAAIKLAS